MAHWAIYRLPPHPRNHGPLSFLHHTMLHYGWKVRKESVHLTTPTWIDEKIVGGIYLFLDSSTVGGSRDSGHSNSISGGNTGSSRCKRGGGGGGFRWLSTTLLASLREERKVRKRWAAKLSHRFIRQVPVLLLTVNNELDFLVGISRRVSGSIHSAKVHSVIPPHDLTDHQICFCTRADMHKDTTIILLFPDQV